ncbi:hypothetical protein BN988_02183 [Oceanobacillus picturae]|uniref:Selenium binding protein n=1 Tax=Oceanobacillus picturae TaxID=171693 RepID=W9BB72_9BACI|nr:hypothetical protein [Oceanobacillus picturae]CDO03665.1 hypothetical protein BN988_02183 [Oceanobacillus picturae]
MCVFNSNNAFIIENILAHSESDEYSWSQLIDGTSGELAQPIKENITKFSDTRIASLFNEIVQMRNRIIHSFQVTHNNIQILATKKKNGEQFIITEKYLLEFIQKNQELSSCLHKFRGY